MDISGIQKLTLLDYPGQCACTVFLAGCNLRCPFCHNASLVMGQVSPAMTEEEFFAFLKKRRGLLVKLDTNGSNPKLLKKLLEDHLLDYVAMDIKNAPHRYGETCGGIDILTAVEQSLAILRESAVEYELRTTLCKPFHDEQAMEAIGKWLRGTKNYYLQNFVDSGDLIGSGISGFTKEEMEGLCQAVLPYIPTTRIRGI